MMQHDLDSILSADDSIEPSPRFAARVMAQVHREAAEPAAPRFPWVRFGAGVAACIGAAVWVQSASQEVTMAAAAALGSLIVAVAVRERARAE